MWIKTLIFGMTFVVANSAAFAQAAKAPWSSGDKGYRLGCSLSQKPCENSCGEIWSAAQKKEQERRCDDHRKTIAQCRNRAYAEHTAQGKVCASRIASSQNICYAELSKSLELSLKGCGS